VNDGRDSRTHYRRFIATFPNPQVEGEMLYDEMMNNMPEKSERKDNWIFEVIRLRIITLITLRSMVNTCKNLTKRCTDS
jgi:hypothetical protein